MSRTTQPAPRPRAALTARTAALLMALVAVTVSLLPLEAAEARRWPGHPDRRIVVHVVRPRETATGLSVRYHAWTREFVRLNGWRLWAGERVRIPVVVSAARRAARRHGHPHAHHVRHHHRARHHRAGHHRARHVRAHHVRAHHHRAAHRARHRWTHADMSRAQVRRVVARTARRYGVPTHLALAVAWQESGWQQRRVSSAGALGVMQVMPATGRWMRWYVGHRLRLRDTYDNVRAGVMLLRVLRASTRHDRGAIAAYYEGLGAVRSHVFYPDTRQYVAAVRAHQRRILRYGSPI